MIWKELNPTVEERQMIEELKSGGVGRHLSDEELNRFPVGYEESFEIETKAGPCEVHLYKSDSADGDLPLLINIHGGGFIKGRRDQDIVYCKKICCRVGCAVLDIDYIPAPAMRYPGQVYACYDVMQYCFTHSGELGIDAGKIAVSGHSAGGTLTAAIILMAIDSGTPIPVLQILDYAGFDMATPVREKRNGTTNPRIPAERAEFYNKMYAEPEQRREPYCSPGFAADEQLKRMPETVMIYCENDTFCDESVRFQNRLLVQGVPVYARRFLTSNHGFTVQRKDEYQGAEKMILDSLRSAFT